jgi:predicted flap endonuclease-1-like 5' DNA nuclease
MPSSLTVLFEEYIMARVTDALQSSQTNEGAPWWFFWLLVVIGLIAVIVGWRMRRQPDEESAESTGMRESDAPSGGQLQAASEARPAVESADDALTEPPAVAETATPSAATAAGVTGATAAIAAVAASSQEEGATEAPSVAETAETPATEVALPAAADAPVDAAEPQDGIPDSGEPVAEVAPPAVAEVPHPQDAKGDDAPQPVAETTPASVAETETKTVETQPEARSADETQPATDEAPLTPVAEITPDKLSKIEGIGPKISGLLQDAGIKTFAQLAGTDVEKLRQVLNDAGLKFASPDTWPEQAALAAAGKWDELSVLQDNLHGGRKKS